MILKINRNSLLTTRGEGGIIIFNNEWRFIIMQILKDDVKQKLLKVSKKLFKEKGIEDTSMNDIALKANISTGNIYRYFKNKDQLAEEILSDTLNEISTFINSVPSTMKEVDYKELYTLFVDNILDWKKKYADEMHILLNDKKYSHYKNFKEKVIAILSDKMVQVAKNDNLEAVSDVLCRAISASIFEGIIYIIVSNTNDTERMEKDLKIYSKVLLENLDKRMKESV